MVSDLLKPLKSLIIFPARILQHSEFILKLVASPDQEKYSKKLKYTPKGLALIPSHLFPVIP
jgi:preprotein translocase subunit Sss1